MFSRSQEGMFAMASVNSSKAPFGLRQLHPVARHACCKAQGLRRCPGDLEPTVVSAGNTWKLFLYAVPSGKLTWQWKMNLLKMYSLLKMGIFHCYVWLPECSSYPKFQPNSVVFTWCSAPKKIDVRKWLEASSTIGNHHPHTSDTCSATARSLRSYCDKERSKHTASCGPSLETRRRFKSTMANPISPIPKSTSMEKMQKKILRNTLSLFNLRCD